MDEIILEIAEFSIQENMTCITKKALSYVENKEQFRYLNCNAKLKM